MSNLIHLSLPKAGFAPALLLALGLCLPLAANAQTYFSSPSMAVEALVESVAINDPAQMRAILGDDYRQLLPLDDVSREDMTNFLQAWAQGHKLIQPHEGKAYLELSDGWVMPIPLIEDKRGWRFDTQAAREEIRTRRIGRNELAAIEVMHEYLRAQKEYFAHDFDEDGEAEYAQRLISAPGKHDGLLWMDVNGDLTGLVDPYLNIADLKGGYYGYHFKILKAQGADAQGGAFSYLNERGQMSEGFALLAWPVRYGDTGVMSFMVNQDGQVFEKALGENTQEIAKRMTRFNPDDSWKPVTFAP
ncbi:MAG: DUF2950 domain-containing protein [Pseudomonadota bacterium]